MPRIVRRAAVDADDHLCPGSAQVVDPADAGPKPHVGVGAVADPDLSRPEPGDLRVGEMDAVRIPDALEVPAAVGEILEGPPSEFSLREPVLAHRLAGVAVQSNPLIAGVDSRKRPLIATGRP